MTQTRESENALPATERAEEVVSRAGERLGLLVGQATLRFQQAARVFREEAGRMPAPASDQQETMAEQKTPANQATTEKAEELVNLLGQRLQHWATAGSWQTRRTLARLREDAEDMWIEAREMHGKWRGKREQA